MAARSDEQARTREAGVAVAAETASHRHRDPPVRAWGTLGRLQWWLSTR